MEPIVLKKLLKPGNRALIVGLGTSGISAVRFLLELGLEVSVSEGGRAAQLDGEVLQWLQEKGVKLETGGHTSEFFCSADSILVSPGIPLELPALTAARRAGIPIFGEMALAPEFLRTPVVAVTGTNGKSTVTSLIGEICRAAGKKVFVGGNIGVPLTDYLSGPQDAEVAVLEISSFQLDTAGEFRPRVAVLLNISPDHLDRYDGFEAYAASKLSIVRHQLPADTLVYNADDPVIRQQLGKLPLRSGTLPFSVEKPPAGGAFLQGDRITLEGFGPAGTAREGYFLAGTGLRGVPNGLNAMAAALAARAIGCPPDAVTTGMKNFKTLPHRLSLVAERDGVKFYDDSKATNEGAAASALQGFEGPVILIAGGRGKGGDYSILASAVRGKVKAMLLLGEASSRMAEVFGKLTRVERVKDMGEAVSRSITLAESGDVVLLAPACASFDMFRSYAHRGETFRQAVLEAASTIGGVEMTGSIIDCEAGLS
jgi:UDP-N-acetylmuramoylalanine--D-glutamate ligase